MEDINKAYATFAERDRIASLGGGAAKIDIQHESGKMTARERIDMLLDKGTFVELDKLMVHRCTNYGMDRNKIPGDGVVSGYGKIDGRQVFVYAYDFTVYGGSLSASNAKKIVKVQQLALKNGAPIIALNDSGGARIQEGIESLSGYADIFYQNTMASGVIPQISAILGPCAGGACYSPALTDFIFMVKEKSHMFVTGPDVVKTVIHEEVSKEELGGAMTHRITMEDINKAYATFAERDRIASLGGGAAKIDIQHESGKMTARERIDMLLDKGTFVELDKLMVHRCTNYGMDRNKIPGDGVVSGYGKIDGRQVFVYAYDFTVYGGSLSASNAKKIVKVQQLALKNGAPIIALNDSGGARIQEGIESLSGYADIFYQNTMASGVIPQISAILGPCAGGACYSPALTDFIFMVKEKSHMFVTGPDVVKTVIHEEVSKEELGGAMTHSSKSGVTHFMANTEEELLMSIRELLSFLPQNNMDEARKQNCTDDVNREDASLNSIVPSDPNVPYDMKEIIERVVDGGYFFEVMQNFAKNIIIGFARMGGRSVGIVANQPAYLAGVLDIDASDKASRFIRFCDCFNIPLITFEDVPGFLPGYTQENNGIIRHGAKIVYAFAEATVPKLTVITRKAYGGAYIVMNSKQTGADVNFAYPSAEIAVMGAEGAVNILFRKADAETKAQELNAYKEKFATPYQAAELGFIDEIILPKQTRKRLIQALEMTENKMQTNPPKKHGNMPL